MRRGSITLLGRSAAAIVLACALLASGGCARSGNTIPEGNLIPIDELARNLADSTAAHPVLVHVGFAPLFLSGHIPGSRYAGPCSKPEGLAALRLVLNSIPPDRQVVLYCGCCPWKDCPNVHPAFAVAKEMGRAHVRVLYITDNLERDWIGKGLPSIQGE